MGAGGQPGPGPCWEACRAVEACRAGGGLPPTPQQGGCTGSEGRTSWACCAPHAIHRSAQASRHPHPTLQRGPGPAVMKGAHHSLLFTTRRGAQAQKIAVRMCRRLSTAAKHGGIGDNTAAQRGRQAAARTYEATPPLQTRRRSREPSKRPFEEVDGGCSRKGPQGHALCMLRRGPRLTRCPLGLSVYAGCLTSWGSGTPTWVDAGQDNGEAQPQRPLKKRAELVAGPCQPGA
jgi:hypothetical protein